MHLPRSPLFVLAVAVLASSARAAAQTGAPDPAGDSAAPEQAEVTDAVARARAADEYTRRELAKVFGPRSASATWSLSTAATTRAEYADTGHRAAAADVSVAADVDLVAAYGRYSSRLATGGEARLGAGGTAPPVSLVHRGFVRPWEFGMMRLELDHRFVWQGTPALSSRRDVWRRPYTREDLRVVFTTLHWRFETARLGIQVGRIEEGPTLIWQHDGAASRRQFELRSDWSLFWLERRGEQPGDPEAALNLGAIAQEAIQGVDQAVITQYIIARAVAVPLGSSGLYVSGGIARSEVTPNLRISGSFGSTTVTTSNMPRVSATTGHGRLHGALGPVSLDAGFERAMYATFDAELALEARSYAHVEFPVRRARVELGVFAAETTVWPSADTSETESTGGGSLAWHQPIMGGWILSMDLEVARSFYGSITDDARPAPSLAVRGGLSLGKSLGRTHTSPAAPGDPAPGP